MAAGDTLQDDVRRIVEQRDESRRWFKENYYDEFREVYRSSKCRTEPIFYVNDAGNKVEDKTRTNVCMPDTAVLIRRNAARLTAQPPKINYLCRSNPELGNKLSAWSYFQYDKSGEAFVQRRHVQQEETFGFSYTKLFWDKISIQQKMRFARDSAHARMPGVLKGAGYSDQDIAAEMQNLGPNDQDMIASAISTMGPELSIGVNIKKYEGPIVKPIFIGDLYPEPGYRSLDECAWIVEGYVETDRWLKYWKDKTYENADGEDVLIFDPKAIEELEDMETPSSLLSNRDDLREELRSVSGQSEPDYNAKLYRGKRFDILECHEVREDGKIWITWVANEKIKLGEMPYPWDLYGKYVYTEFVGLPDLITGVGDSTPRLGRFLQSLHNVVVNQRTDLVSNLLRPLVFRRHQSDVPDEVIERALFRLIDVRDPSDFTIPREQDAPPSAWESENQVIRMFGLLDGALTNIEAGSNLNPQSGKTATTAVLQQRALDAMTQYKLDGLNLYHKQVGEKKLWMLQQFLDEDLQISPRYSKMEGLSNRYPGSPQLITLDKYEIQEDIEVEPEAGSTLAVDDQFRRMEAERLYQMAASNPIVWNITEAAKMYASTVKGADPSKLVNPPTPPPPPPPKAAINLAIKWTELPADIQNNLLQQIGLPPSQELVNRDAMHNLTEASVAADAAVNLMSPATPNTGEEGGDDDGNSKGFLKEKSSGPKPSGSSSSSS